MNIIASNNLENCNQTIYILSKVPEEENSLAKHNYNLELGPVEIVKISKNIKYSLIDRSKANRQNMRVWIVTLEERKGDAAMAIPYIKRGSRQPLRKIRGWLLNPPTSTHSRYSVFLPSPLVILCDRSIWDRRRGRGRRDGWKCGQSCRILFKYTWNSSIGGLVNLL